MKRELNVYARETTRKPQCHFSLECKQRASVVVSTRESRRAPKEIFLCEEHAKKVLNALQVHYNIIPSDRIDSLDGEAQDLLARAGDLIRRQNALIEGTLENNRLSHKLVEGLLSDEGYTDYAPLKEKGLKGAVEFYLGNAEPEPEPEEQEVSFVAVEDVDTELEGDDLTKALIEAAEEEGV